VFRFIVIGVSGSGKTMLARQLARKLDLPHIELDALYWEANWQGAARPVVRGRVQASTAGDAWVVDGNYSQSRGIVWSRATHLVWLDYSLSLVMRRVLWRTFGRLFSQEDMWSGNRQSLGRIFGRESIVWYAFTSYRRHRKKYPALLSSEEFKHLTLHRFKRPQEASAWLQSISIGQ
jgi:adenylate kinase family enzyme